MPKLIPAFRHQQMITLEGVMAVYHSQAEASEKIPQQWQDFLPLISQQIQPAASVYGASPCTSDGKIHYLSGISVSREETPLFPARVTLEAGEYAVFTVDDAASFRATWIWVLREWLPASGRKERTAAEFERYQTPALDAPVEIWIPLEPVPGKAVVGASQHMTSESVIPAS